MLKSITLLAFLSLFSIANSQETTTHRELQFENEYVKVWKTVIMPNQPLNMHRHENGRVIVGLIGGSLTKIESTGETSLISIETDKAFWLDKDPKDTLHADINESDEPIEVMVIEVKSAT